MGCCSSAGSQFRDIYAEMLSRFQLIPRSNDFTSVPKDSSIEKRTKIFESLQSTNSPRKREGRDPFDCSPTEVRLPLFLNRSEVIWNLNQIHPYNGVLTKETVISLCFIRSIKTYEEALKTKKDTKRPPLREGSEWEVYRWDLRLWMLSMCEFYHTLSLLVESKCIPTKAIKWFLKMQGKNKAFFRLDANGNLSPDATKAITETDDLKVKKKEIPQKLIDLLKKEMPSIFKSKHGPGKEVIPTEPAGLFTAAAEYMTTKQDALKQYAPKQANAPKQQPKKPTAKEKEEKDSITLISLVEWITLRYTRSLCGKEEDKISYLPVLYAEEEEGLYAQRALAKEGDLLDTFNEDRKAIEDMEDLHRQLLDLLFEELKGRADIVPLHEKLLNELEEEEETEQKNLEETLQHNREVEIMRLKEIEEAEEEAERAKAEADAEAEAEAAREKAEQEKAEREKAEQEKAEREKAEREKAEQEKAEQEKAEQEKAEQEKAEQEKAELEKQLLIADSIAQLLAIGNGDGTEDDNENFRERREIEAEELAERERLFRMMEEMIMQARNDEDIQSMVNDEALKRTDVSDSEEQLRNRMHSDNQKSQEKAADKALKREKQAIANKINDCKDLISYWRELTKRMDAIDKALLDESLSTAEREALLTEKKELQDRLQELFTQLAEGGETLSDTQCRDGLYKAFGLEALFPDRIHCDPICERAFLLTVQNAGDFEIKDLGRFRTFLRTYITLLDLYGDIADAQNRNWNDGLEELTPAIHAHVLRKAYQRGDIFKDMTFNDEVELNKAISEMFRRGSHKCDDDVDRISFYDVVDLLMENAPDHLGKYPLQGLDELKVKVGADGSTENQQLFIQNLLEAMPADGKNPEQFFVENVDKVADLKSYSRFHDFASMCAATFCSNAVCTGNQEDPFSKYYHLLQQSQAGDNEAEPSCIVPLTCKSVFLSTAVVRSFEDTRNDETGPMTFNQWQQPVSFEWFSEAMSGVSEAADTPLDVLLGKGLDYIRAGKEKGGYVPPSEDEASITSPLQRAFHVLEQAALQRGAPGVRVDDVVHMCLFSQAAAEFSDDRLTKDFLTRAFVPNYIHPEDRRSAKFSDCKTLADVVKAIQSVLPSNASDMDLYQEFVTLSRGCRSIPFIGEADVVVDGENIMNLDVFIENFKDKYQSRISHYLPETHNWFHEAAAYITMDDIPFTARRYRKFIQYLVAAAIAFTAFFAQDFDETDMLSDDQLLEQSVPEAFIEKLMELADSDFHTKDSETLSDVLSCLPEPPMLRLIVDWYCTYRVRRLPPTCYDNWESVASLIPFTCSADDRLLREKLIEKSVTLGKEQQSTGMWDNEYLNTDAISAVLAHEFHLAGVMGGLGDCSVQRQQQRQGEKEEGNEESSLNAQAVAGTSSPPFSVGEWFNEHVVPYVNRVAHRSDLPSNAIHWSSVRFSVQYIHHFFSAFFASEEVCKEVEAMIRAEVGPSARPKQLSAFMKKKEPAFCTYVDVEHIESTVTTMVALNFPDAEVETVKQEIMYLSSGEADGGVIAPREKSAFTNPIQVAHIIAERLTQSAYQTYEKALELYRAVREEELAKLFEEALLSGKGMRDAARAMLNCASYWERLRFLLPHQHSTSHRSRRKRLYEMMDKKGRSYLSLAELHSGTANVLHLYEFREDTLPALFRAFFAMKECAYARDDVIFLTGGAEQIITPPEFCGYLDYFYQYLEMYFMFDVMTCAGRITNDLHVQSDIDINPSSSLTTLPAMNRVDNTGRTYSSPAEALHAAAKNPYQLCMESARTPKVVTLPQFKVSRFMLRHWGCAINSDEEVEDAFRSINRRCAETGEMHFTDFAIWASKRGLHPDGYGALCDDKCEALAALEGKLLEDGCAKLREEAAQRRSALEVSSGSGDADVADLEVEYI